MDLVDLDKRYVWHPFTQMRLWNDSKPLVIERGEGNDLIDTDGNRYLDGVSSLWTIVHGHGRPEIQNAIREQLDALAHSTLLGLGNVPSIRLAEQLAERTPEGLSKVFYSDNGSTAVEIAVKMAFQYWQNRGYTEKRRFVHLQSSYHGDTLGAVSVGGIDLFHEVYGPLLFETLAVPHPNPYRNPHGATPEEAREHALGALEALLRERADEIAAFVLEPLVQGAAGMLVHPPGYLRRAAELCRRHGVLLIADEVATGFGRTGSLFACEQEGVTPDFLCLAKGITGGYLPLAATVATQEVFDAFLGQPAEGKTFYHGHTYTGNPLACAAALASLEIFDKDRVLEGLAPKIERLEGLLQDQIAPHPAVGDVRQRGLMVGIELVKDKATAEPFPSAELAGARACLAARERGVLIRPLGDVVILMPPLSATEDDLSRLVAAARHGIDEAIGSGS